MSFSFEQNVLEHELKYINNKFISSINSYGGECISRDNLFVTNSIGLNPNLGNEFKAKSKIINENIKMVLKEIQKIAVMKNIDFSAYSKDHREFVIFDKSYEDFREYGFIRLIFKDSIGRNYVDEIPISPEGKICPDRLLNIAHQIVNMMDLNKKKIKRIFLNDTILVFSPKASGYFVHETLGHALEADIYKDKNSILHKSGIELSKKLTIIDNIDICKNLIGLNIYDDEGIKIKPITLIKGGILENCICTKEYNDKKQNFHGMARRESYRSRSLPRMRGTFIQGYDNLNNEEIVSKYKKGVYLNNIYLGNINLSTGEYVLQGNGFSIENRELTSFIDSIMVKGNISSDLNNIQYIGNDFDFVVSECYKKSQIIRVCAGGPTISIKNMNLIGDIYG